MVVRMMRAPHTVGRRVRRRLQYVAVLGHHQHGDEVNDGQRQELRLLRLLLRVGLLYNTVMRPNGNGLLSDPYYLHYS